MSQGKKANWLVDDTVKHSFTYVPDATKAVALLGNSEQAYGQVWHLPTASNPLTGKEWIQSIANEMGVTPKYRVIPKTMVKLMGFFVPVMRETVEMLYQYDRDYVFDSSLFEQTFDFTPTPYLEAIRQIIALEYQDI